MLTHFLKQSKIKNISIINEDFLKWENNFTSKIKIVGNLPYYISSPIIFKLLENTYVTEIIIMVQKELGMRICAKPNTKDYSRISILCQTFCDVSYECDISKNIFIPKPKVDSCLVRLNKKNSPINIESFSKFIKQAFTHRRKKLKNNLKDYSLDYNISDKRPEDISVIEYIDLYKKYFF